MSTPSKRYTMSTPAWTGTTAKDLDSNLNDIYAWLRSLLSSQGLFALLAGGNIFTGQQTFSGQYVSPLIDNGNAGAALAIDWSRGNEHYATMTANCTFTLSNPVNGGRYVLLLHSGSGGYAGTWPASVLWSGAVAPVLTTTANKVDLVTLMYVASLGQYIGAFQLNH